LEKESKGGREGKDQSPNRRGGKAPTVGAQKSHRNRASGTTYRMVREDSEGVWLRTNEDLSLVGQKPQDHRGRNGIQPGKLRGSKEMMTEGE